MPLRKLDNYRPPLYKLIEKGTTCEFAYPVGMSIPTTYYRGTYQTRIRRNSDWFYVIDGRYFPCDHTNVITYTRENYAQEDS